MKDQIITGIRVTRFGVKSESITIEDDHFFLSGTFVFLSNKDKDEFLDELRQTFELICPFGCTVELTSVRFKDLSLRPDSEYPYKNISITG